MKRIITIILLLMLNSSLCFAEEVIHREGTEYPVILLNAKTVNDYEGLIKARVKSIYPKEYFIDEWIIQRITRRVMLISSESYEINGNFKRSSRGSEGVPINPPSEAVEKIIRYIDREGK